MLMSAKDISWNKNYSTITLSHMLFDEEQEIIIEKYDNDYIISK